MSQLGYGLFGPFGPTGTEGICPRSAKSPKFMSVLACLNRSHRLRQSLRRPTLEQSGFNGSLSSTVLLFVRRMPQASTMDRPSTEAILDATKVLRGLQHSDLHGDLSCTPELAELRDAGKMLFERLIIQVRSIHFRGTTGNDD